MEAYYILKAITFNFFELLGYKVIKKKWKF